jgi:hypothetical protein
MTIPQPLLLGETTMRALILFSLTSALLSATAACADDGMPDAVRKSLNDGLIGEWSIESTLGDIVSKETYVAKWSPGKQSIRIEMMDAGEDESRHASELMGWDADAKCLVIYGFGPDSSNWTIRYTDMTSKIWKGEWKGFFNGKVDGSSCTLELRGDSFVYRDTTDGKPLVIKATRK